MSYLGSNYHGWQVQPNATSIQEIVNEKLSLMLQEPIHVIGCGRTDTGVHARNFYAHFDSKSKGLETDDKFVFKLNSFLPRDISIFRVLKVHNSAHSRYDATDRTYKYYICSRKDVFNLGQCWHLYGSIDIEAMNEGSKILMEYNDFTSFSKLHTQVNNNLCQLKFAKWKYENKMLVFEIQANRFLRNMVRSVVGTLVEIGRQKLEITELRRIIEAKDRRQAGMSVPAEGLFLENISYPYIQH